MIQVTENKILRMKGKKKGLIFTDIQVMRWQAEVLTGGFTYNNLHSSLRTESLLF